jgi:hypothetical protein
VWQNNCGQRATQVHHVTYLGVFNELPNELIALVRALSRRPAPQDTGQRKSAHDVSAVREE